MDPVSVFNALYDTKCIKFGKFILKSGLEAPYYVNLRRLPLFPSLFDAIVCQVVDRFLSPRALKSILDHQASKMAPDSDSQPEEESDEIETSSCEDSEWDNVAQIKSSLDSDTIICGVPYGAIPIATAIAYKAKLPFLFDRKESKLYGDHQPLIGASRNAKRRVVLIEDVICSGESVLETIKRLARQNIRVEFVIVIVDREINGCNLLLEQNGVHVVSLYKMSAILRILETTGRISSEQFINNREWIIQNQCLSIGSS